MCIELKEDASLPLLLTNKGPTNPGSLTQKTKCRTRLGTENKTNAAGAAGTLMPPKALAGTSP